nr:immunoglobulin heavy chain junction region [Macaca mulatta]MOX67477.1 immunoglobulin heavy chain junction region [Macaca mulatta]
CARDCGGIYCTVLGLDSW